MAGHSIVHDISNSRVFRKTEASLAYPCNCICKTRTKKALRIANRPHFLIYHQSGRIMTEVGNSTFALLLAIGVSRGGGALGNCPVLENLLPSDFLRTGIWPSAWEITVTDTHREEFNGKIVADTFKYVFLSLAALRSEIVECSMFGNI